MVWPLLRKYYQTYQTQSNMSAPSTEATIKSIGHPISEVKLRMNSKIKSKLSMINELKLTNTHNIGLKMELLLASWHYCSLLPHLIFLVEPLVNVKYLPFIIYCCRGEKIRFSVKNFLI